MCSQLSKQVYETSTAFSTKWWQKFQWQEKKNLKQMYNIIEMHFMTQIPLLWCTHAQAMLFAHQKSRIFSVVSASSQFLRHVMLAGKIIVLGREVLSVVWGMHCPVCAGFPAKMCYCPHSSMGSYFCHLQTENRPLCLQPSETPLVVVVFFFLMEIQTFQKISHLGCLKQAWIEYVQQGTNSQQQARSTQGW